MAKTNPYLNRFGTYDYRITIEEILWHPIPKGAVVHHIDGNPKNNANSNLVLCQNQKYHYLLHIRKTALEECGNKHWRKCVYCGEHDDPAGMKDLPNGSFYHRVCCNANRRKNRQKDRGMSCR